ncbi:MAG: hypothetical protein EOP07_06520, partial [Proteobacteria bacterium]
MPRRMRSGRRRKPIRNLVSNLETCRKDKRCPLLKRRSSSAFSTQSNKISGIREAGGTAMNKTVAIVGAGAVGQMMAYLLQRAGFTVLLFGREGALNLSVSVVIGEESGQLEIRSQNADADIWLFATKAYDIVPALLDWLPKIPIDRPIILLANGFLEPVLTDVRRDFPRRILRKGVVSRGAKFAEAGRLLVSPRGEILWGAEEEEPRAIEKDIMSALSAEGFHWDKKACEARKTKWFCNTVLNTLTAACRLKRNGDALEEKEFS